jgi:pyruvate kinase
MSRITTGLPIIAMSRHTRTLNIMALYRGVKPVYFDSTDCLPGFITKEVVDVLRDNKMLNIGDKFILTYGDQMETVGATNVCKVVTVS